MTTPLCNCPENMGWGTQADYTTAFPGAGSVDNAQSIYCVNGSPAIGPRGGFRTDWAASALNWDPDPDTQLTVAPVDIRTVSGATVTDTPLTNPYPYPMQFMAFVDILFWCTLVDGQASLFQSGIRVDGTPITTRNYRQQGYSVTPQHFLYYHYQYPLPELAAGATMTVGHNASVSVNVANAFGLVEVVNSSIYYVGGTTPGYS